MNRVDGSPAFVNRVTSMQRVLRHVVTTIEHGEREVGMEARAGEPRAEEGKPGNARVNPRRVAPGEPQRRGRRGSAARGKRRRPAARLLPGSARARAGAGGDPA